MYGILIVMAITSIFASILKTIDSTTSLFKARPSQIWLFRGYYVMGVFIFLPNISWSSCNLGVLQFMVQVGFQNYFTPSHRIILLYLDSGNQSWLQRLWKTRFYRIFCRIGAVQITCGWHRPARILCTSKSVFKRNYLYWFCEFMFSLVSVQTSLQ